MSSTIQDKQENTSQEDIINYIIEYLKANVKSSFGYDLYLPNVMAEYSGGVEKLMKNVSPYFYDACWELCRRGILRPGVRKYLDQSTSDGNAGNGYSITPFGNQWLAETDKDNFVPTEPERFAKMLSPYPSKFGAGFHERAQQAIRCYGAHAYLACCVMCGAAAESILLKLVIVKQGDEAEIINLYKRAGGRKKLEALLIGDKKTGIKQNFETCFSLLKYWRDEAAHGRRSDISENEAYTSLALLLRCAQFANDSYNELTE